MRKFWRNSTEIEKKILNNSWKIMETLLEKVEVIRNWRRNFRNFLGNNFSEIGKRLQKNIKITVLEIFQFFQNPLAILKKIIFNFFELLFYLSKINSKCNWNPLKLKKKNSKLPTNFENMFEFHYPYIFFKKFKFAQNFSVIF